MTITLEMAAARDTPRDTPRLRAQRPPSAASTASSYASSAINRLCELNQCPLCKNTMTDPRHLPCHHSFCANCIRDMIRSAIRNEFLCPLDRTVVTVPARGLEAFPSDQRILELEEIRAELELGLITEDPETADLDINLESLNKGVKDIEHSSAMSQHEVNTMFENIYKALKKKQEQFLTDIKRKSKKQISLLEFEKFRLIETKKFQSSQMNDSCRYEASVNLLTEPFNTTASITNSSPPSPSSMSRSTFNTIQSPQSPPSGQDSANTIPYLALMSCHIGQQHLNFERNEEAAYRLEEHVSRLGNVVCDFDLKIKLDRNLLTLSDFQFGMKIDGNSLDWTANQPIGISKRHLSTSLYIVNRGRSEIVQLDNSFIVTRIISGRGLFSNKISDVASCGNYIYVADASACQIVMLNEDGTVVKRCGRPGNGALEFKQPNGICIDSRGRVIVADSLNHRIKVLSADLQKCIHTIRCDRMRLREATNFSFPCGVTVDRDDNIYVVDTNNKRVVQLSKDGKFLKVIYPPELYDPRCVAVSSDRKILLTDREKGKLLIFDMNGSCTCSISGIIDSHGCEVNFKQPYGVVVDGTDKIFVTDVERNSVFVL